MHTFSRICFQLKLRKPSYVVQNLVFRIRDINSSLFQKILQYLDFVEKSNT